MKNLAKFLLFVLVVSAGISLLYDYRLKHGGLKLPSRRTPEKYTLASEPSVDSKQVASLEALNRERRELVKSVVPSVVAVKTSKKIAIRREYGLDPFEFFFPNQRRFRNPNDEALVQNSLGSGVIVTNEGHIITNNHVVTDRQGNPVDQIEVQLSDGRTKKARLVGADDQVDVAVLKIDDPEVKPLKLADSDTVQPGDFVLAIGNPLGFEETVTDGIISSKGRPNRSDVFADLLQTNAAINPGNSGGPLINLRGEVIGINTVIASTTGGSQGLGFAIPSNSVRTALESLLKQGRIIRGYLGIQTPALRPGESGIESDGVTVAQVQAGSPAAQAGVQPGDVIRRFDGREVKNLNVLRSLVAQTQLNKEVELEIVRDGKPLKVKAQIKEQPVEYQSAGVLPRRNQPQPQTPRQPSDQDDQEADAGPLASIQVEELSPEMARQLDLPANVKGVLVISVDPDSGTAELQKGDVIEEINQQPVTSVSDYNKIAASLDPRQPQVLSVCRHRSRSFLVLRPR
ncbi:MAG TPA: trypsin-like peptidase domain-containing protein [Candidatus Limnocylindria bacterium]|jgi:serine protease Do|nr:trypsin-like peptidase domain-containing protein [Candidatus Limnocylindria bacterium]